MEILKKKTVKDIARAWKKQYRKEGEWFETDTGCSGELHKKLLKAKTVKEANKIIGNNSWGKYICDDCFKDVKVAILFSSISSSGSSAKVCINCFCEGFRLIMKELF